MLKKLNIQSRRKLILFVSSKIKETFDTTSKIKETFDTTNTNFYIKSGMNAKYQISITSSLTLTQACFNKKGVPKSFVKSRGKHLKRILFFNKFSR